MHTKLLERLRSHGPKRVLSLDAGGMRGVISLGYLAEIERTLRQTHGRADLRLSDYFDLIGGVSTGAIIATGLALGMEVHELTDIYLNLSTKVFGDRNWLSSHRARFNAEPFAQELQRQLGDTKLGDDALQTGLCIITKRADTNSTWYLINHPDGKFYDHNRRILLSTAIRASAAAPTFFAPEVIDIGEGEQGAFIDGAIGLTANPSLPLFLVATLHGFPFRWRKGADDLFVVSIGTGYWDHQVSPAKIADRWVHHWAVEIPKMFIEDARWHSQLLMQLLSQPARPQLIDLEVGDLSDDLLLPEPALTYLRYDLRLDAEGLRAMALSHLVGRLDALRAMDNIEARHDLYQFATRAADADVWTEDFPAVFEVSDPHDARRRAAAK